MVCLLGPPTLVKEPVVVDAAVKAGVKYIIPSGFGYDFHDPEINRHLLIFRSKMQVDSMLQKYSDRISYTWVVVGLFLDWVS